MRNSQPMLALALAAACLATTVQAQTLTGHWSGVVTQSGPNAKTQQFVATLTLDGAAGAMDYPTLECGGDVAFVSRSSAGDVYRETISRGRGCLSGGTITVKTSVKSVLWRWDGGDGVTVSGRLYRVATAPPPRASAGPGRGPPWRLAGLTWPPTDEKLPRGRGVRGVIVAGRILKALLVSLIARGVGLRGGQAQPLRARVGLRPGWPTASISASPPPTTARIAKASAPSASSISTSPRWRR